MQIITKNLQLTKSNDIKASPFIHLQQLYEFEFAPITKMQTDIHGRYSQEEIKQHWSSVGYDIYIIRSDKLPIGFAVINLSSMLNNDPNIRDVAEFFIMPAYRKQGVGKWAAIQLFEIYPTHWEIRQLPGLEYAKNFWESVVRDYTNDNFQSSKIDTENWKGYLQQFNSK